MNITYIGCKNYLSFEKLELDLKNKDGVFLIVGRNSDRVDDSDSNGSGKSTFASIPAFALFGRCRGIFDKELLNEDIIYVDADGKRKSKCEVVTRFDHGINTYEVKRTITDTGTQKLQLSVFNSESSTFDDISYKAGINKRNGKRENGIVRTQQRIDDILGCNADLFVNSVYFEQSNIDTFATGTLGDKDELIKAVAGIYRWGDYSVTISEDIKDCDGKLNRVTALINEYGDVEELTKSKEEFSNLIVESEAKLNESVSVLEVYNTTISEMEKELVKLDFDTGRKIKLKEDVNKLKTDIEASLFNLKYNKDLANRLGAEAQELEHTCTSVKRILDEKSSVLFNGVVGYKLEDATNTIEEIREYSNKLSVAESKLEDIIAKGKSIATMKCPLSIECASLTPEAKASYRETLLEEHRQLSSRVSFLKSKLDAVRKLNRVIDNDLRTQALIEENNNAIELYKYKYSSAVDKYNLKKAEQNRVQDIVHELTNTILENKNNLSNLELELVAIESNNSNEIRFKLNEEKVERDRLQSDMNNITELISEYKSHYKRIDELIEKTQKFKDEYTTLSNRLRVLKYALNAVRRDIPHNLVKNVIPELEQYSREFLYKLSSGRMDLEFKLHRELKTKTDGSNLANAFDIVVSIDGNQFKYAQTSGGERARVDVAIHLAYVCFMSNRSGNKLENIWLDEVGMALDEKGVSVFVEIINQLRNEHGFRKIFVITQNSKMKRMFDNVLTVVKSSKGSILSLE